MFEQPELLVRDSGAASTTDSIFCRDLRREALACSLQACVLTGIPRNLNTPSSAGGIIQPLMVRVGLTHFPDNA